MPPPKSSLDELALRGKRICVVQDDHVSEGILRVHLLRMLSRAGVALVGVAANGPDAIEMVVAENPDLVLIDADLRGALRRR